MRRTILVAGASGQVAHALSGVRPDAFDFVALGRPDLDLCDPSSLARIVDRTRPAAIVNAAAYTAVDKAESEPDQAFAVNRDGAAALAAEAARRGLPIVHISTDYVFSGEKDAPYTEEDAVAPLGVYGRSKLEGERAVAAANPAHAILRTAWVYGAHGSNFFKTMLRLASERDTLRVVADQRGTPTYAPDIAAGIAAVLNRMLADPDNGGWRGVFHMVAEGETTWAGFAQAIMAESGRRGGPSVSVHPIATADYPTPARRPANSRLSTKKFRSAFGYRLPDWRAGVGRCLDVLNREKI